MKINKPQLFAIFGIMVFALAIFAIPQVTNAYGYADDCEYYGDCYDYEDYSYDDYCDYGCDDYYYDDYSTDPYIVNNNTNDNYLENNTEVIIDIYEDEEEYPAVSGYCSVNVSRAETGDTVTWEAQGSGGNGYFSYDWSGTDGLSSYYPTVSKQYNTRGTKTATVEIYSNYESIYRTCTVVIEDENDHEDNDDLDGYCTGRPSNPDEDERVTWTAYPEGGDGDYEYEWSGTDNLDGDDKSISKRYDDEGTKTARVRITSDNESITKTCTVRVDEDNDRDNDDLEAYCKASPDDGEIGDRIRWTVYADGGDGDYDYDWDGDDNLRGDDKSISMTYTTSGRKDAEVVVRSDGDRVTAKCDVDIDREDYIAPPLPPAPPEGGIYLSSIPATGISPTVKVSLFVTGLFMWSAFLAYLYIARKNEKIKEQAVLESLGE